MSKLKEILKLKELLDTGLISENDYNRLKSKIFENGEITNSKNTDIVLTENEKECPKCKFVIDKNTDKCIFCDYEFTIDENLEKTKVNEIVENSFEPEKKSYLIVKILVVIIAIVTGYFLYNNYNTKPQKKGNSTIEASSTPSVQNTEKTANLDTVTSGDSEKNISSNDWKKERFEIVKINFNKEYLISFLSKKTDEFETQFLLTVTQYSGIDKDALIWKSTEETGFKYEGFHILKSKEQTTVVAIFNLGGAHALNRYFVINIDKSGNIEVDNQILQYGYVESNSNELTIVEENQIIKYVKSGKGIIRTIQSKTNEE
jgi:hypothetical protein